MALETVRVNTQGKEQLSRLKRHTKIEHWNVLCRWAFCISLAEPTVPPKKSLGADDGVEMTWRVFGGRHHELYYALLKQRCRRDGYALDDQTVAEQFRLHLHRGLGYLAADRSVRSIAQLLSKALPEDAAQHAEA